MIGKAHTEKMFQFNLCQCTSHAARKRLQDNAKEVENLKTEEVKRRRGRVYGKQEEKEEKMDEEEADDKEKGKGPYLQIEISPNAFLCSFYKYQVVPLKVNSKSGLKKLIY